MYAFFSANKLCVSCMIFRYKHMYTSNRQTVLNSGNEIACLAQNRPSTVK